MAVPPRAPPAPRLRKLKMPIKPTRTAPKTENHRAGCKIARGHFGIGRQAVDFRFVHQQVKRIQAAEHLFIRAVKIGSFLADLVQLLHALLRSFPAAR